MSEYWVARNGERYGPYSLEQLTEYYKSGQVLPSDQVCRPGSQEWVIASSMSELSNLSNTSQAPPTLNQNVPNASLVGPILVTLFCCMPFGIVGIVYAAQVQSKVAGNDIAGAQASATAAKNWTMWGFIIGLLPNLIFFGIAFLSPIFAGPAGP